LRRGESFEYFKNKFILLQNLVNENGDATISDEELKKIFIDHNYMDLVIKKLVSYCPNLFNVFTRSSEKRELIKSALNEIDWNSNLNEIYETAEEAGDIFMEIYFEDSFDKIPRLRLLDPINMQRALLDDMYRYKQYIYKETVEDESPSYTTGMVNTTNVRDKIIVFEKGRKVIFDPKFENGETVTDDEGNIMYNVIIIPNRDSYKNDFSLIHIKGQKKQREEFSEIPASKYVDLCLALIACDSDIRLANKNLGAPMIALIDGFFNPGSKRTAAALLGIQSTQDALVANKQAELKDIQIKNDLNSMFAENTTIRDILFSKAGLITPTLLEKLNIDSSRVIQQLNLPSENKIELYVDNIIKSMQLWFKILLKENDMYDEEEDKNLSFIKPKFIIKSSPFDELLYEQSEIKSTKKSRQEIYIENGDSEKAIDLRKEEINEEIGDEGKDKSFMKNEVIDRVSNGQKVDKNMINT